jgi:SRSO17 transposase
MQRFLSAASWDQDKVLDDVRDWMLAHLGDDQAILVIDLTGDLKKGT